jgi:dGTPase
MRSAESRGRKFADSDAPYRTPFQRDRDRVIHSTAFRRLEYKTQVFVNSEGDHFRTRLTHTLEVAQISRTVARALHLNEDLTEAIALAHDLGHTPFGHSGEEALDALMSAHGGFEHNAQGLRVVDELERRYGRFPGLNLTYEVRESFAKHSTRHDFPLAHSDFTADEQATLEAQIAVIADEIAYDNHDLDDGLSSGLLDEAEVQKLGLWKKACRDVGSVESHHTLRRAQVIRRLISILVTDAIVTSQAQIEALQIASVEDVRRQSTPLIQNSREIQEMKEELEHFLSEKFYRYFTVIRMTNKAQTFLSELFQAYVMDTRMLPPEYQDQLEGTGVERVVCDYIAGMTDRYAQQEYRRLFYPFEKT